MLRRQICITPISVVNSGMCALGQRLTGLLLAIHNAAANCRLTLRSDDASGTWREYRLPFSLSQAGSGAAAAPAAAIFPFEIYDTAVRRRNPI
jgi:hypothetical protein